MLTITSLLTKRGNMKKQENSRYCFMCGLENPIGLKLSFYADDGRVMTTFTPDETHQGYPGTLHGGIICALLDETIGRTLVEKELWAMTAELNVRFRRPIPLHEPVTVYGEIDRLRSRMMEGKGHIELGDGTLAATAEAKYILLTDEQVAEFQSELPYWQVSENDSIR